MRDGQRIKLQAVRMRCEDIEAEVDELQRERMRTTENMRGRLHEMTRDRDWERSRRVDAERRLRALEAAMRRGDEDQADDEKEHKQPFVNRRETDEM